jgi:hypothetical protein
VRENATLRRTLEVERAAALVDRHHLPEVFGPLLASLPPNERDDRARAIAEELRTHGSNGDGADHDSLPTPGSEEDPVEGQTGEPPNLAELQAIERSGPQGGQVPGQRQESRSAMAEQIARTRSWEELEGLQRLEQAKGGG